ncbi:hypothetical protein [Chania multitudinisentens]|uniref:hypothetical protein n=1 Tax=Chania multitudinisentens TaxID=1639108 RepID=UPI0003E14D07|nr:hypothetical protein [Chania multitudinisentens]
MLSSKKCVLTFSMILYCFSALAQAQQPAVAWTPPGNVFLYMIPIVVIFGSAVVILAIRSSLPKEWSLADALSEDVQLPVIQEVITKNQNGVETVTRGPIYDINGKPVLVPVMKASSSRLIALMGMLVILFMFIGFGSFVLYGFGKTGNAPESIDQIVRFLAAGMTLFAPYVVNKFSSLFQGLTSGK